MKIIYAVEEPSEEFKQWARSLQECSPTFSFQYAAIEHNLADNSYLVRSFFIDPHLHHNIEENIFIDEEQFINIYNLNK